MRTLTLLRLILRLLREIKEERRLLQTQLALLNQTARQLLEVAAKQANYMPSAPVADDQRPARWALGRTEAEVFVAGEQVRQRLTEQLGREPLDEEFFQALEANLTTSAERRG